MISHCPVKIIELVPSIYASSKIPHTVNIHKKLTELIDDQAARGLPYILSIKLIDWTDAKIHPSIQKTGQVFYFTINNKDENIFKYLGKTGERDPKKLLFLATFLEANTGNSKAQTRLAEMYFEGYGVKKNIADAIRYFTLAEHSI